MRAAKLALGLAVALVGGGFLLGGGVFAYLVVVLSREDRPGAERQTRTPALRTGVENAG